MLLRLLSRLLSHCQKVVGPNLTAFVLLQILSYLRAGSRSKKKKKDKLGIAFDNDPKTSSAAGTSASASKLVDDIPLYDDVGDYVPSLKRDDNKSHRRGGGDDDRHRRDRDRDRNRERKHRDEDKSRRNYFDRDAREAEEEQQKGFSNQDKEM